MRYQALSAVLALELAAGGITRGQLTAWLEAHLEPVRAE